MSIHKQVYDLLSQLPETVPEVPDHLKDALEIALAAGQVGIHRVMTNNHPIYITQDGRAALAEHRMIGDPTDEPVPLLEQVLNVLTPNQSVIMNCLWDKKTVSFDVLKTIHGAFRDVPSDGAITAALKKMRLRLDKNDLSVVCLTISTAKKRVSLERPQVPV